MKKTVWLFVGTGVLTVAAVVCIGVCAQGPIIITGPIVHDADDVYWLLIDGNGSNRIEVLEQQIDILQSQLSALVGTVQQLYYQLWDLRQRSYAGDPGIPPSGGFRASPPSSP